MEEYINKIPNWLRYILAIPVGIFGLFICYYIGYFANLYIASPDSWCIKIYNFMYNNGINVFIMIGFMNYILPKHQFSFTLTISIIFCSLGLIGLGMSIMIQNITILYIIGFITTFLCFIIACYYTFKEYKIKGNTIEKQIQNTLTIDNKYIKLSEIVMQALDVSNIDEALEKTCDFYIDNGVEISNIEFEKDNKYEILSNIIMEAMGTKNIDEAIEKTITFYRQQGIDIK